MLRWKSLAIKYGVQLETELFPVKFTIFVSKIRSSKAKFYKFNKNQTSN